MTDDATTDWTKPTEQTARRAFPVLDEARYRPMVQSMDMTDEQAREFLSVLWWIMCGFVELGFGASSCQRVVDNIFKEFTDAASDAVQSEHPENTTSARKPGGDDEARH